MSKKRRIFWLLESHARLRRMLSACMAHVKESAELGDERSEALLKKCRDAHAFSRGFPLSHWGEKKIRADLDRFQSEQEALTPSNRQER